MKALRFRDGQHTLDESASCFALRPEAQLAIDCCWSQNSLSRVVGRLDSLSTRAGQSLGTCTIRKFCNQFDSTQWPKRQFASVPVICSRTRDGRTVLKNRRRKTLWFVAEVVRLLKCNWHCHTISFFTYRELFPPFAPLVTNSQ